MRELDWDQLRFLLAVHRGRTYAAAARLAGVDDATVSRRMRALEDTSGQNLFLRGPGGVLSPTAAGQVAVDHAERIEAEVQALSVRWGQGQAAGAGTVRVTAVPVICNRLLAPKLAPLLQANPHLTVELAPEARSLNLSRREADLALRFGRPGPDTDRLWARRIATLRYGLYAAAGAVTDDLPLISYAEDLRGTPVAQWIEARLQAGAVRRAGLQVLDAETAHAMAVAGLGLAALPDVVARADPRLRPVAITPPPPSRDLWLIGHRDQRGLARIGAVVDWIGQALAAPEGFR